jgi:2-alkenal reductase
MMKVKSVLLGSVITLALVFAIVVGCVGGVVAAPYIQQRLGVSRLTTSARVSSSSIQATPAPVRNPAVVAPPTATPVPLPADASPLEQVTEQVYRQVSPSVVYIEVVEQGSSSRQQPFRGLPGIPNQPPSGVQMASGSGFVLDKDGHILTNNHVVDGASQIEVTFIDGTTVRAQVVGRDPFSDLAVIKVDVNSSLLQPVELGDSSTLVVGQNVFAIGNPFGQEWTMTSGIVSGLGRTIASGATDYSIPEAIQTDAAINPGNSGGPLLDSRGRVIGVNTQIESQSGSSSGVGFAVPVNIIKQVAPALIQDGQYSYSWLGIQGGTLTLDLNEAMNLPANQRGALVIQATPNGPAAKAGIQGSQNQATVNGRQMQVGGDVITAVDSHPVTGIDDVIDYLVNATHPGDKITLTVLRDGRQQDVQVTLGERPTP